MREFDWLNKNKIIFFNGSQKKEKGKREKDFGNIFGNQIKR